MAGAAVIAVPRLRADQRARDLARNLGGRQPAERIRIARELAATDLRASAGELLLLARTDHEPAVLDALARAVLDAPAVARPSANLRELLEWAAARATAEPASPA
jgi:hypothetical protein